jgi:hypothetical protein
LIADTDSLRTMCSCSGSSDLERIAWADLPGPLKQSIEARTGPVIAARTATAGQNSPLAAIIRTGAGTIFAKGMPPDHRRVSKGWPLVSKRGPRGTG